MLMSRHLTKPMLLLAAAATGGVLVSLAVAARGRLAASSADAVPPILSVEAAQRQVPFRIQVPTSLPKGAALRGVRVSPIVLMHPERHEAQIRANTKRMFGYGITINFDVQNNKILLWTVHGSPAERAGLARRPGVQLLSVNGYRPGPAKEEKARQEAILRMSTEQQREAIKTNPCLLDHFAAEPLRLTVKDPNGAVRTIVVPRREWWTFRPERWKDPAGNRAALLYALRGKQFVLHESRSVPEEKPVIPRQARRAVIKGTPVWFSGPRDRPSAFWQHDGVDFTLNNYQLALTRQEALDLINALLGSNNSSDGGNGKSANANRPKAPGG
jgi:hypothetical protein